MGHMNSHALLGTLACIDTALVALDIIDSAVGVQAAVRDIALDDNALSGVDTN